MGYCLNRKLSRSIAHGNDPEVAKVIDAMTEGIIGCYEDDKIEKAAKSMGKHRVRRLPVLNENGNITGMISIADLALNLDNSIIGEVFMEISK
jgi:CBS domain-containing protein